MSSQESDFEPLLSVTMSRSAAERFKAALSYADSLACSTADAQHAPGTRAKIEEHADWLRWGRSRVAHAEQEAAAANRAAGE